MRRSTAVLFSICGAFFISAAFLHGPIQGWWADHKEWFDSDSDDNGPPDPDYWITRNTYPTGNFDPQWVLAAAAQERRMATQSPAGLKNYTHRANSPLTLDPGHFVSLGPMPENNTQMSYGHISGRANVIRVDPTTVTPGAITVYSGSDGGGIWKSTNCCTTSTTWSVVTDVPEVASMSISDIAIDPNNHNVIYAGTGDLNFGSFSFGAAGVLKSSDQGQSWALLGADSFGAMYPGSYNSFPQYQAVGKVVVDPNNSNIVLAGTKTSLYISYDAGSHWSGPCYTNPYATGATPQRQDVTGLIPVSNGDGTTRVYVAIGTRGAPTPVQPDLGNTGSNGVYMLASLPASGCPATTSWALQNVGWPSGTGNGTAGGTALGRIEIAVAPSQPSRMYAEAEDANTKQINSIYRSDDAGATWTKTITGGINTDGSNVGCESSVSLNGGSQMWYDAGLTVDPNNPDRVWMSTTDGTVSSDGGHNFYDATCGWNTTRNLNGGVRAHVDHHARAFVGNDSTQLLLGSDGGVYYSANADAAVTSSSPSVPTALKWIELNDTIDDIEFYFGDIGSNFATAAKPVAGAGAQDNGCSAVQFTGTPTGPALWNATCGGDGTMTKIEPVNNNVFFNSSQNGALARNLTYGTTLAGTFATASGNTRDPGVTGGSSTWGGDPVASIFAMSYDIYKFGNTSVAGSGCDSSNGCNHMIAGTTRLWENIDITNANTNTMRAAWKARTADLTKDSLNSPAGDIRSYINYVAYSFTDPTVAAVATNDGNVQIVFGLGTAVTANCPISAAAATGNCAAAINVTDSNNVLPNRPIFGVRFDPTTPLKLYAAVGGFNANTPGHSGHLFQVTCSAVNCPSFTWQDKTGNLPDVPAEQVMPNPNLPNQVFVGTDWGLYYTDDITANPPQWNRFENFPHTMVWELVVDRGFTTLAAFTRSRGAWAWPLPNAPVGTPTADLSITNSGPLNSTAGSNVSYLLTASNAGPATAQNVIIANPTPAGLTLVSVTGDCSQMPCAFAGIGSGESKSATVTFAIPANYDTSTAIMDTATIGSDADDPDPNNNSHSTSTTVGAGAGADVQVTIAAPLTLPLGKPVVYTYTVTNNGPASATGVALAAGIPAGLTFASNSGDCSNAFPCTFGTLAPNESRTVTTTVCVPHSYSGSNPILFSGTVSTTGSDANVGNNSNSASTFLLTDVVFLDGFESCP